MTAPLSETGWIGSAGVVATAPLLGMVFGWSLERGGLGSAPKLAGQFYFADFTVFKVMFSALITAMIGAFWLNRLGFLDLDLVYLPETYAAPQALGGVLFGAGFLLAGLCPGTSCVAAAAGRVDGFGVVGGMLTGVVVFNAVFGWVAKFYESTSWGAVGLPGLLGISRGIAVAVVTAAALLGFIVVSHIEKRIAKSRGA